MSNPKEPLNQKQQKDNDHLDELYKAYKEGGQVAVQQVLNKIADEKK
jgi:hypothetical protein